MKDEKSVVKVEQQVVSMWQGPLPSPDALRAFESVVKGAAERVLTMAEEEARVRRSVMQKDHEAENCTREKDVVEYHGGVKRGQYLAFFLTMTIVVASAVIACLGHEKAAMVIAGVGLANIAATFIGRKSPKQ